MATRNTGGSDEIRNSPTPDGGALTPPTLKEQAVDLGKKANRGVRQAATQAQSQAQTRIERGKADAAVTLTSVATSLLNSGMQLRDDQQQMAGEYVERAARQIEKAANYMQNADLREMVDEVENFARRRPALFIGSAFAAGLLAARFLKSSRKAAERPTDESQSFYMDREVQAPVANEMGRATPASGTWEDSPL